MTASGRPPPRRGGQAPTKTDSSPLSHDVKIGGKDFNAGTYALFLEVERTALDMDLSRQ